MEKYSFIKTKDKDTADVLKKNFTLLSDNNGIYVFANCPKEQFDFGLLDKSKYIQTNTLTF